MRGPDWFTDGYRLSPGATDLLTLFGAEHTLGGIHAHTDTGTTDENPERVALIAQVTLAYYARRSAFLLGMYQAAQAGYFAGVDPLLSTLLNREPRTVRDPLMRAAPDRREGNHA